MTTGDAQEGMVSYPLCGGRKHDGSGTCQNPAGKNTDHVGIGRCAWHGGATQNHRIAARRIRIVQEAERFGVARGVDPATGILECVHKAAGQVDYFEDEVNNLETPWVTQKVPGGERVEEHPAITAYRQALNQFFSYSERTLKLDLFTRQIQIEEAQAVVLAALVTELLDSPDLALSRDQRELGRQLAGRKLRALAAGPAA